MVILSCSDGIQGYNTGICRATGISRTSPNIYKDKENVNAYNTHFNNLNITDINI